MKIDRVKTALAADVNSSFKDNDGMVRPLADVEADLIMAALIQHGGCVTGAAKQLGIARSTFYRRMQELGM